MKVTRTVICQWDDGTVTVTDIPVDEDKEWQDVESSVRAENSDVHAVVVMMAPGTYNLLPDNPAEVN